ncbi:MAG: methionine--tRNA ligase [Desulfocurvibacter africanus]
MDRFYITTPIYYVNGSPHLGHAYTTLVADSLARFHRAMGQETFFLTGTDEHGDKIVQAADKAGISPQALVDANSAEFHDLWKRFGITNTGFVRTTEERHKRCVQAILQKVFDAGDIYHGEYSGHYCFGCERFLTDKELVDGKCPDHQIAPELISEKNYFFRMSKYQGWLAEHIKANPGFIRPQRYEAEVLSMLEGGVLEDLCISRPKTRLTWGIELPFDTDYVCYVWFDALLNYVSALGWPEGEDYRAFWPVVEHLVAKDILKPHAVFWPTMLKSAGLSPYRHLNVHGYWLVRDTKMSKSLGNVVDPLTMADKYGLSAFRYFLLREMQFGSDASFSEEALVGRLNADLANDLGNLFSRTLTMTSKYFQGQAPDGQVETRDNSEILELARTAMENFQAQFAGCVFSRALESLWELVRGLNKYVDSRAPWTLAKEERTEELATVMATLLMLLRKIALHLVPVMPEAADEMLAQLGQANAGRGTLKDELCSWNRIEPGTEIAAKSNIFPRVDLAAEMAAAPAKSEAASKPKAKPQVKGEAKKEQAAKAVPASEELAEVEFQDFQKLDLRVGMVLDAVPHPDADRLLKLTVDIGESAPRQIVAGLAEFFTPEQIKGRQVTVLANLKPRKLRGLESQGMVLAVRTDSGMELLTPSGQVKTGSKVS